MRNALWIQSHITLFVVMALKHFCQYSWGLATPFILCCHGSWLANLSALLVRPSLDFGVLWETSCSHGFFLKAYIVLTMSFPTIQTFRGGPNGRYWGSSPSYFITLASPSQHLGLQGFRDWNALKRRVWRRKLSQLNL